MPALFRDLFCSDPGIRASGIRQPPVLGAVSRSGGVPRRWPSDLCHEHGEGDRRRGGASGAVVSRDEAHGRVFHAADDHRQEVVRGSVGYEKKRSIRAATPFLSLIVFASFLPLYFQTAAYSGNAMAEMGAEYGAKIASYGNFGMFLLVLVLSVIAGMISERLSEKILKMEEPERPIFLHN